ncbi:MAG: hypothetical protein ACREFU_06155 [Acetobacteraceae bacterium]
MQHDGDAALRRAEGAVSGIEEEPLGGASVRGADIGGGSAGREQAESRGLRRRERRDAGWRRPGIAEACKKLVRASAPARPTPVWPSPVWPSPVWPNPVWPNPVWPNQRTGLSVLDQGHLGGNGRS